jgi:diadenylate cyclase
MTLPAVSISVSAVLQVAILYLVIYAILKRARGSRFGQALAGVGVLAAVLFVCAHLFHFDVLTRIVQFLLLYLSVSTVVIFQPEIRRFLSAVGTFGFVERAHHGPDGAATPDLVTRILLDLARQRTGALVAFERGISLRGYESTGVRTDAIITPELVHTVLTPPLPLHDGGIVVRNGRMASAHCIFPVSNNPSLVSRGMRHRAAVGLSEETDALVLVVSEERGSIAVAHNGHLFSYDGPDKAASVRRWITRAMSQSARQRGLVRTLLNPVGEFLLKHWIKPEKTEKP